MCCEQNLIKLTQFETVDDGRTFSVYYSIILSQKIISKNDCQNLKIPLQMDPLKTKKKFLQFVHKLRVRLCSNSHKLGGLNC